MTESTFFQDLAMLMTVAGIVSVIFSRLGWPKVLGYILSGILLGSHTWGGSFLVDPQSTQVIGQLGVVFLMFAMGLSFSARDMKKVKHVVLPAAILDTLVMIWIGYTVGMKFFGWSPVQSLFLGVAICDSATTLLAKVIDELGWRDRPFTKYVIGTSVCEDIVCVGAIAVVTGFANGNGLSLSALATSLGWLAVFLLAVVVFGMILVPRLIRSVAKRKDDEVLLLSILGCCFFVSYYAYCFNFSLALGAFLVGIVGGASDSRHRIAALVDPLKSMFAAVFFVSIGLLVDPVSLTGYLPEILLVSLLVIGGKCFNTTVASVLTGLPVKTAIQNGFALAQIGEFAFMVAILYAGIVDDAANPLFPIAVGVSLLTTVLNPLMIRISDDVGSFAERMMPAKVDSALVSYRAWIAKLGAAENSPALMLIRVAAIKLAVYAVLILSVATGCYMLCRYDFSRFSVWFERYDEVFFFLTCNLFTIALLPLILSAAQVLGDEIALLLTGDGDAKWQQPFRRLVRFVVIVAVLMLFFAEWTMVSVSVSTLTGRLQWISVGVVLVAGVLCWNLFVKAGRSATKSFLEALTAEERRDGLVRTMTVSVPEGVVHRLTLSDGSPAVGETVVSLNIRAKTGASVVSVYRDGRITRNIGPEWEFRVGDTLVVLGESRQIAALKDLLGVTQ